MVFLSMDEKCAVWQAAKGSVESAGIAHASSATADVAILYRLAAGAGRPWEICSRFVLGARHARVAAAKLPP
jgi:hypothetical protein